jgi:hypothetical protein
MATNREHYTILDADYYDRDIPPGETYPTLEEAKAALAAEAAYTDRLYVVQVITKPVLESRVTHTVVSRDLP